MEEWWANSWAYGENRSLENHVRGSSVHTHFLLLWYSRMYRRCLISTTMEADICVSMNLYSDNPVICSRSWRCEVFVAGTLYKSWITACGWIIWIDTIREHFWSRLRKQVIEKTAEKRDRDAQTVIQNHRMKNLRESWLFVFLSNKYSFFSWFRINTVFKQFGLKWIFAFLVE